MSGKCCDEMTAIMALSGICDQMNALTINIDSYQKVLQSAMTTARRGNPSPRTQVECTAVNLGKFDIYLGNYWGENRQISVN